MFQSILKCDKYHYVDMFTVVHLHFSSSMSIVFVSNVLCLISSTLAGKVSKARLPDTVDKMLFTDLKVCHETRITLLF